MPGGECSAGRADRDTGGFRLRLVCPGPRAARHRQPGGGCRPPGARSSGRAGFAVDPGGLGTGAVRVRRLPACSRDVRLHRRREPDRRLRALRARARVRPSRRSRRGRGAPRARLRDAPGEPRLRRGAPTCPGRPGRPRRRVSRPAALAASEQPLVDRYDGLVLDLDGVVQLDDQPVAHAVEVLGELNERGRLPVFLTNNASRPPAEVAGRLGSLGVPAKGAQILTSAMVAADVLARRLPHAAEVLVVGGAGLVEAIKAVGLQPVSSATAGVAAVVQGWAPDVGWPLLAEGAVALRAGAQWIATNTDRTLPSPRGPLPGNGSLVAALRTATGLEPEVVGKPEKGVFDTAAARTGGSAPLMIGDRLDTDIAGARAAGLPTLLVLTGVARPRDLLAAPPEQRPTYVGRDLRALLQPQRAPQVAGQVSTCGGVVVHADGAVTADGGLTDDSALDGLRAVAALAWAGELDESTYDDVVRRLGL